MKFLPADIHDPDSYIPITRFCLMHFYCICAGFAKILQSVLHTTTKLPNGADAKKATRTFVVMTVPAFVSGVVNNA